jgi:Protein of unknown function (DUF2934)
MSTARILSTPTINKSAEEKIRVRAYELFERRGGEHGRALDDWLQAEAEFLQQRQSAPPVRTTPIVKPRARKTSA